MSFLYDKTSLELRGGDMPRARSPDSYKAEEMYKQGMKLVDIAKQLNISEGTVRSWKNRYNFDGDSNATLRKEKR